MPQTIEMPRTAPLTKPIEMPQLDSRTVAIVEVVQILNQLDEEAIRLILDCARDFIPYDDEFDYITEEDIEDLKQAHEEYLRGETVTMTREDWNLKER
ncbi:MAG: hypothetical protein LBM98_09925 [Oscillospiraceae bacterium]|jgi:hypothetical protein|nr:hypothetical protein [Oscillospiraceae bacterium]